MSVRVVNPYEQHSSLIALMNKSTMLGFIHKMKNINKIWYSASQNLHPVFVSHTLCAVNFHSSCTQLVLVRVTLMFNWTTISKGLNSWDMKSIAILIWLGWFFCHHFPFLSWSLWQLRIVKIEFKQTRFQFDSCDLGQPFLFLFYARQLLCSSYVGTSTSK